MKAGGIRELEAMCMPAGTDSVERAILAFLLDGDLSSAILTAANQSRSFTRRLY